MLLDMSADKPKSRVDGQPEEPQEASSRSRVELTGFKASPFGDGAPGDVETYTWEGDEIAAEADVLRQATGLVISRLVVTVPDTAPAGLTHQKLRQVPLGDILAAARARKPEMESAFLRATGGPSAATLPPGRLEVTDELLRQVALAYLEETGPGKDRAVLQRLADRFGRPKGTVRTWIGRARSEGWLGPAVQGRMGAEAGPRLLDDWAQSPMAKHMPDGTIFIQAPPPKGSESPEEARARVRKFLDERQTQGPPNRADLTYVVYEATDEEAP